MNIDRNLLALAIIGFVVAFLLVSNNKLPQTPSTPPTPEQVAATQAADPRMIELNVWLAKNPRRYTEADKVEIRECMLIWDYRYGVCAGTSRAELDDQIRESEHNSALAQERVDEATRNLRQVCRNDPAWAARNPVTCSQ
jgi:hypothetical protein